MNKILINAARYIEAMHDIKIDENDPRLDSIIRKYVLEIETPELINYWKAYLADIDIENSNTEIRESVQAVKEIEKAILYRGAKLEQDSEKAAKPNSEKAAKPNSEKAAKPKKQILYRGAVLEEPIEDSGKREKNQPVYRGVKFK